MSTLVISIGPLSFFLFVTDKFLDKIKLSFLLACVIKNLDNAIYYYYIVLVPYTYLFPKLCRGCCQRGILPVERIIFETLPKSCFLFGINPGLNFTCLKIFEELGPAFGPGCLPFSGLRFNH